MNAFAPPKKKIFELLLIFAAAPVFYLLYPDPDAVVMFVFGFVWNWAASNDLSELLKNPRYRMSMISIVVLLQSQVLRPVSNAPAFVKKMVSVLPAGLFWLFVIFVNGSELPFWPPFVGSIVFELLQLEMNFLRRNKEKI